MSFLATYPDKEFFIKKAEQSSSGITPNVNAHIHSPYSYSSFNSIEQSFEMALKENIEVLGINDFFVTDGYAEFESHALKNRVFPLFNIEFIGLMKDAQTKGVRINDPNNPGRIYVSGKGLKNPLTLDPENESLVKQVINESQLQIKAIIEKANQWFFDKNIAIQLNYSTIKEAFARELVRERHIAKAIRVEMEKTFTTVKELTDAYQIIFNGKPVKSEITEVAAIENEIRGNLLKSGGPAFVEETEASFLDIKILIKIIRNAGGIPCYPVLLDDNNGFITEFEANYSNLAIELTQLGIACIELIPNRNDFDVLKNFASYFDKKGFAVLLGTEHNTPDLIPITPSARGKKELDEELKLISYKGVCVVSAHQYLVSKGEKGYVDIAQKTELVNLGKAIIDYYLSNSK